MPRNIREGGKSSKRSTEFQGSTSLGSGLRNVWLLHSIPSTDRKKPKKEESDDVFGDVTWDDLDLGLCDLFNPETRDEVASHSDNGSEEDDF